MANKETAGRPERTRGSRGPFWRMLVLTGLLGLSCFADVSWLAELVLHCRLHLAGICLLLTLASLFRRRGWLALLGAATCLAYVGLLLPWLFLAEGTTSHRSENVLRVLCWNIQATNQDSEAVVRLSEDHQADVVMLLEYTPGFQRHCDQLRQRYPYHRELALEGPFGIAVYSKHPGEFTTWELDPTTPCLEFQPGDKNLSIWAVHLFPPISRQGWDRRNQQLERLAESLKTQAALSGNRQLVAGDFNLTPWTGIYQRFCAELSLLDVSGRTGYAPTWPVALGWLGIPIDQVAATSELAASRKVIRPAASGSDHAAVLIEVEAEERQAVYSADSPSTVISRQVRASIPYQRALGVSFFSLQAMIDATTH